MRITGALSSLAFTLLLQGCALGWGGNRSASVNHANPADELGSLRAERNDLRARLHAARMRDDTRSYRSSSFPAAGGMETWQMQSRLSELEHRIRTLEDAQRSGNTSVEEVAP